jgi:hypothetical protein
MQWWEASDEVMQWWEASDNVMGGKWWSDGRQVMKWWEASHEVMGGKYEVMADSHGRQVMRQVMQCFQWSYGLGCKEREKRGFLPTAIDVQGVKGWNEGDMSMKRGDNEDAMRMQWAILDSVNMRVFGSLSQTKLVKLLNFVFLSLTF